MNSKSKFTKNITPNPQSISSEKYAQRFNQKPCVIWLSGLSGSGKSSIANALNIALFENGNNSFVLDGDNLRLNLCADLGFSTKDRAENIRRASATAELFAGFGAICICAFISPLKTDRQIAKSTCKNCEFIEIFVNTPLEICEKRDVKGLYAKARANLIAEFSGISAPYEVPQNPNIELKYHENVQICDFVEQILEYLEKHNFIKLAKSPKINKNLRDLDSIDSIESKNHRKIDSINSDSIESKNRFKSHK